MYTRCMKRLIEVLIEERSKIGLYQDTLSALWAEVASNEGMNQIAVLEYVSTIILKEN